MNSKPSYSFINGDKVDLGRTEDDDVEEEEPHDYGDIEEGHFILMVAEPLHEEISNP